MKPIQNSRIIPRQVALTVEGVNGLDKGFVRRMGFAYFVDLHVREGA